MSWRDHLPIHPTANLFPLMSESELRELGEDIMVSPIILYQGKLLDGRSRLDAMELVGIALDFDGEDLITDLPDAAVYELRELDGDP